MVGTRKIQPAVVGRGLVLSCLLAVASVASHAQPCTAAPPAPGASAAVSEAGAKFRLIAAQCPGVAGPTTLRRAEQLALFDRAGSLAISLPGTEVGLSVTTLPAPATLEPLDRNGERVLSLAPALTAAAREYGLDPLLLHAIAHVESRHNAQAVSPAGALGVMQVMPATAQRFGVGDPGRELHDVQTNVRAGAAYLQLLDKRFGGNLRLVVAAYNAGEGAVEKYGRDVPPYRETQGYVRDVLAIHRRLGEAFEVSKTGELVARNNAGTPATRGSL